MSDINMSDHDNKGPLLRSICAFFVSISFIAVSLRCYVRIRMVKSFGWDDGMMVLALLCHIMFATCAIGGVEYGTGRHMWDLTPEGIFMALRYWWLCYPAYCTAMFFAKISIGLFLLRVTTSRIQIWIIYTAMALTAMTGVVFFFVVVFQCHPVNYFWDRSIPGGSCISIDVIMGLTYLYSVVSGLSDFTLGILPIFLIKDLQMTRRMKIALIPILSMGCIASCAIVVRMFFIKDFKTNDFLYKTVNIAIWSDTEQGLAITAGSLATLRPLYRKLTETLGMSTGSKGPSAHIPKTPGEGSKLSARARRSPYSIVTTVRGGDHDEEFGLSNVKPIRLEDEESRAVRGEKDIGWTVSVNQRTDTDASSQEELKPRKDDDMYLPGRYMQK